MDEDDLPKQPPNAYLLFSAATRSDIKKDNPDLSPAEVTMKLAEQWTTMSDEQKAPFKTEAEKLKMKYHEELGGKAPRKRKSKRSPGPKPPRNAYLHFFVRSRTETPKMTAEEIGKRWTNMPPEERREFEDLAENDRRRFEAEKAEMTAAMAAVGKSRDGKKKRRKDPNAPKHPQSSYMIFSNEKRGSVKAEHPGASIAAVSKLIAGIWNGMSSEEKAPYVERAKIESARYKEALAKYTAAK